MEIDWDREYEWKSYRGIIKIKDMDDAHIVNVVHYLKKRLDKIYKQMPDWEDSYTLNALFNFTQEMKSRKIPESLLENAPYEFEDGEGCLRKWNYETNSFTIKSPALRYVLED